MNINFSPFPNINTDRLHLRRMTQEDANEIYFFRSDEEVTRYTAFTKANNVDDAKIFIEKIENAIDSNESIFWAISLKNETRLIGTICLWNINVEKQTSEIGYMLHPDYQGKGIMQEAIINVIDYGFNNMQCKIIEAGVDPENIASIKVLEKNGFREIRKEDYEVIYSLENLDMADIVL